MPATRPCPYCHADLPREAQFCTHCGARLLSGVEAADWVGSLSTNERKSRSFVWIGFAVGLVILLFCGAGFVGGLYFLQARTDTVSTHLSLPTEVEVTQLSVPSEVIDVAPSDIPTVTEIPSTTVVPSIEENQRWAKISHEVYFAALRRSPGYIGKKDAQDILVEVPAGERVKILSGPEFVDGLNWWRVIWMGTEGWIAEHTGSGKVILIFE